MKALVTGGGGFLGRYIVEQLAARGDEVRILGRRRYDFAAALGVECMVGDVSDPARVREACRGIEVVFHTAAKAGIWGAWQDYFATNTLGTRRILEACREVGVAALVYSSSPSVTFSGSDQRGVDESEPYPAKWLCVYPHTKALAKHDVLDADEPGGLATCALRPHLIWGPRDGHLIPRLIERARSGKLRRVGNGRNRVDMIYVENAAEAHLMAADALLASRRGTDGGGPGGKAYFISQGEPVSCWDWIDQILGLVGLPPIRRSIGFRTAWTLGAMLEAAARLSGRREEPRMTRFLAAQLAKDHFFSIEAARRDFGYRPSVSTEEGMRRLGAWLAEDPGGGERAQAG